MSEHRNEKNLWTRQEDAGRQQSHAGGEFYSDQSMNHVAPAAELQSSQDKDLMH